MGGISFWQVAIVVIVIAILFGSSRLRNLGSDLGASLKGFKKAIKDEDANNVEHKKDDGNTSTAKDIEKEKTK